MVTLVGGLASPLAEVAAGASRASVEARSPELLVAAATAVTMSEPSLLLSEPLVFLLTLVLLVSFATMGEAV